MRKLLLCCAAMFVIAAPASAADLPVKAPPYVAPVFSWSGFYIGATLGGAWSRAETELSTVNGASPVFADPGAIAIANGLGSTDLSETSFIFGGKAGLNWQSGPWVIGIEGDISWTDFDKDVSRTGNPFVPDASPPFFSRFDNNASIDWLATVRGRLGYAFDRFLVYGTGGAAFGDVSFSNTYRDFAPLGLGFGSAAASVSETRTGWTAGAGIDWALTNNWILSVEYVHVDLGEVTATGTIRSDNAATAALNFSTQFEIDIVRAGLAYKF